MRINVECEDCKTKYGALVVPGEKVNHAINRICPTCKKNNLIVFEHDTRIDVYNNPMLLAEFYDLDDVAYEFTQLDPIRGSVTCKIREHNDPTLFESPYLPPGFVLAQARHFLRYKFSSLLCYDKSVLDVGCGCGYGSYIISKTAKEVKGIDVDKGIIEFAKENYKKDNIIFDNITIEELADKRLVGKKEEYDIAISVETLEHINPIEFNSFFSALKNLIKSNGIIAFTTPRSEPSVFYRKTQEFRETISHYAEYSKKDFIGILEKNGLRIEQYLLQRYDGNLIYNAPKNLEFSFGSPLDSYVQIAICRKR